MNSKTSFGPLSKGERHVRYARLWRAGDKPQNAQSCLVSGSRACGASCLCGEAILKNSPQRHREVTESQRKIERLCPSLGVSSTPYVGKVETSRGLQPPEDFEDLSAPSRLLPSRASC